MRLAVCTILVLGCVSGIACYVVKIPRPDEIVECHKFVRNGAATNWCLLKYDGRQIVFDSEGDDYNTLVPKFTADKRLYAYIRIEASEVQYVMVTCIGAAVSPLKKAAVSTDKGFVKVYFDDFNMEILADERKDVAYANILSDLERAIQYDYKIGARAITSIRGYLNRKRLTGQ